MGWARLETTFSQHPKVVKAGPMAELLFTRALQYCRAFLTDGRLDFDTLPTLGQRIRGVKNVANKLVEVGLWEKAEGGWRVHDYLDFNPSAAEIRAEQRAGRERVARYRERHGNAVRERQ